MTEIETITTTLAHKDLSTYLRAIDNRGWGYSLAATDLYPDGRMRFELWVDGSDHNGTTVTLHPDGTWSATTDLVIGERE